LHVAARYLQYRPDEWLALPWPVKRMHLEGLAAEGLISLDPDVRDPEYGFWPHDAAAEPGQAPMVGSGGVVLDLEAMRKELAAAMGQPGAGSRTA
jgi:hypothetical protein